MSSKKFYLKDNNKTAHWVGHARLKPLDIYDFSTKKVVDDIQASLTGTTFEQSASGRKWIYMCCKKLRNNNLKR